MRRSAVRIRSQAPGQRACDRNGDHASQVEFSRERRQYPQGLVMPTDGGECTGSATGAGGPPRGGHYWRKGVPCSWRNSAHGGPLLVAGDAYDLTRQHAFPCIAETGARSFRTLAFSAAHPWNKCPKGSSLDPPNQPTARGTSRRGIATTVASAAHGRHIPCRPTPHRRRRAASIHGTATQAVVRGRVVGE